MPSGNEPLLEPRFTQPDLCRHMAPLRHNKLIDSANKRVIFIYLFYLFIF